MTERVERVPRQRRSRLDGRSTRHPRPIAEEDVASPQIYFGGRKFCARSTSTAQRARSTCAANNGRATGDLAVATRRPAFDAHALHPERETSSRKAALTSRSVGLDVGPISREGARTRSGRRIPRDPRTSPSSTARRDRGYACTRMQRRGSRHRPSEAIQRVGRTDQPSLVTSTFSLADTSGCSLTCTSCSPSFLIGSSSWTLRLSISTPLPFRKSAMSPEVTEP